MNLNTFQQQHCNNHFAIESVTLIYIYAEKQSQQPSTAHSHMIRTYIYTSHIHIMTTSLQMMNTKYIQIRRRRRHTLGNYSIIGK